MNYFVLREGVTAAFGMKFTSRIERHWQKISFWFVGHDVRSKVSEIGSPCVCKVQRHGYFS